MTITKIMSEALTMAGVNAGAISGAVRVLTPGGRLVMKTGSGVPVSRVLDSLMSAGFQT